MRDREWMESTIRGFWGAVLLLLLTLPACVSPPDPDGVPLGALRLPPGLAHDDALDCRRNDCVDWYRTELKEEGTLEITVSAPDGATGQEEPPQFTVTLTDPEGRTLGRERSMGRDGLSLVHELSAATYLVSVTTPQPRGGFSYQIELGFEALPPPPPPEPEPQFRTQTSAVLEVEGWGQDSQAVLIELGRTAGMRPGLRGRLVEQGDTIGEIVIEQVYPDGSRARIDGTLSTPITPSTTVEIDVPVGAGLPAQESIPTDEGDPVDEGSGP
jgi:hypothetical protein